MASTTVYLWLSFMIITQTVGQDIRSEEMSVVPDSKFQCANTTCLPFISVITTDIKNCQFACLGQSQCIAATFHRSTSNCELFNNMLNQNGNISADVDATSMNVISGTRFLPVTYCAVSGHNILLYENQFIYSSNQLFAFGILTPNWGIFHVGAYGSIGSTSWQPSSNISSDYYFQLQEDGNVVLLTSNGGIVWGWGGQRAGAGGPYAFYVSNTGELVLLDRTNQIVWQRP
ncbi:unnamed protein product [Adineta steineri]|uniref:Bulb-type lectin domain-containing protein n=1 Tax=Adineta steineri TaxID=433720 RepID=A0A815PNS8_9BILA|nr:unnamed protein product [Adineta steineri]CAF1451379.1 unnamed protein product [Adineta steineri]CAF3739603.1 unnamed protein product [Adineta steineri]CAF4103121.1 unnamed protein product [Adineta steineri]